MSLCLLPLCLLPLCLLPLCLLRPGLLRDCRASRALALLLFVGFLSVASAAPPGCQVLPPTLTPPESVGLSSAQVEKMLAVVRARDTDGFALLKDGKLVAAFGHQKRLPLYSVTKPISGLGAGLLFTQGKLTNLDAPLSSFFPDLAQDPKGPVTLRQLMTHTSGIADARDEKGSVLREWNNAPDWVAAARTRPLREAPGTVYRYNNQGPVWVSAIVEKLAGRRLDQVLADQLFAPLCIEDFSWLRDKAGHTAGYTGLALSAFDLAKIGQLLLNRGQWGQQRLLAEAWVNESALRPASLLGEPRALLWALAFNEKLKLPLPLVVGHTGDGGQILFAFPNHGIVVARLRKKSEGTSAQTMGDMVGVVYTHLIQPAP